MLSTTTLIVGAGQCGLAMSYELTALGVDHLMLDAGQPGESWRSARWDSLRMLSPNWMNALAGEKYSGPSPDGFMTAGHFADSVDDWVARHKPPLRTQTHVTNLKRYGDGYLAQTNRGEIYCRSAVLATGACAMPKVPGFASALPARTTQLTPLSYRNPGALPAGDVLVVGSSASGLQIARELAMAGRNVTLAVGNHGRLPRRYRGADILMWMHLCGVFDEPYDQVDDIEKVRRTPSLPLIGTPDGANLDLATLQRCGVEITGRMADIRDGHALFSGGLANMVTSADLKLNRLLDRIDAWVDARGIAPLVPPATRPAPVTVPSPRLRMDLQHFGTVIWATGFTPDHRFVDMPVFDHKNRIRHDGGVVAPGLVVMGLPYLRNARSTHIDGAPKDAQVLARHIHDTLTHSLAA